MPMESDQNYKLCQGSESLEGWGSGGLELPVKKWERFIKCSRR